MARMTLDQLEIFLATAEHLHFTKAAEASPAGGGTDVRRAGSSAAVGTRALGG